MKIGLALVAVAIVVAAGVLISLNLLFQPPSVPAGEVDIQLINGETVTELNFSRLLSIPSVQGFSSYQNRFQNWRGMGHYIGVTMAALIELIGGMDANDVIRVNATDGYTQYFSYDNLYPDTTAAAIQGQLILAYSYNGTVPTTWGDGPKTAFLPSDGAYSNDDANATTHPAWFDGSAGARWVRNVATIEILHDIYVGGTLHVTIVDGETQHDVYLLDLALMTNLEAFSAYQKQTGSWSGNGTYIGVPLSAIIELLTTIDIDDVVTANASDYSQSYAYYNLYPNSTIQATQGDLILAYIFNGTVAPSWVDGPRIAFLAPDGAYSNEDASLTTYPDWFKGSAGARWVQNVLRIEIYRDSFQG